MIGPYLFLGKFVWTNGPESFFKFPPTLALVHAWLFPAGPQFDAYLGGPFGPQKKYLAPTPQIFQFAAETLPAPRPPSLETPAPCDFQ